MKPGDKFGRRVVVGQAPSRNGVPFVVVRCDCSEYATVAAYLLKAGRSQACAKCARNARPLRYQPVKGDVFGQRTVIGDAPPRGGRHRVRVKCSCGQVDSVDARRLVLGKSDSCMPCSGRMRTDRRTAEREELSALRAEVMALREENAKLKPCEYCDGSGDVHSLDGEWQGVCVCAAGTRVGQGT